MIEEKRIETVLRGLSCWANDQNTPCKGCPYEHDMHCRSTVSHESLDIIKELKDTVDKLLN